jgi:hypothetical protein
MKDLKKRNIIRTVFFFCTLLLSLAAVASAQDRDDVRTCSNASVAGTWGYSETGTLYLPTGAAVPYASLGRYTLDPDGNYSGTRVASVGGTIQKATFKGTATVNSDCTGTVTISFYGESGNLLSTVIKTLVYVDNAREVRAIVTSVVLPNGASLGAVLTTNAKKQFPNGGNEHQE